MKTSDFGRINDGRVATLFELSNSCGVSLKVTDLGASIVSLNVPDRQGHFADVVLGFDDPNSYLNNNPYIGSVVGRFANRIDRGKFELNGKEYVLATNNEPNHLHGGNVGFDKRVWQAKSTTRSEGEAICFSLTSDDGDEGYPGRLDVNVTYILTASNEVIVEYSGKALGDTIVNLSQHSYFNLAGHDAGLILDHELMICGDYFTPVNSALIPTGEIHAVAGSALDFRQPKRIGRDIEQDSTQLKYGGGYDHNWVLNAAPFANELHLAAVLVDPNSARQLEILTDQPGLQFYSGNFLDESSVGKSGAMYGRRCGLALETQHFPDSPNQPHFPRTTLRKGCTFDSTTIFRFSVVD
jgi:aldose 1-epimerase